jgi:hypothetical protein
MSNAAQRSASALDRNGQRRHEAEYPYPDDAENFPIIAGGSMGRYNRSAEVIDLSIAPELPLAGGEISASPPPAVPDANRPPKLMAVETRTAKHGQRRPARQLPPELPRLIRVHAPIRRADTGAHRRALRDRAGDPRPVAGGARRCATGAVGPGAE